MEHAATLVRIVDEIATDIGRLRRHPACEPESSLWHVADRLASRVEDIDCIVQPSAAELVAFTYPGDDETVQLAIAHVDRRARQLRATLGGAR